LSFSLSLSATTSTDRCTPCNPGNTPRLIAVLREIHLADYREIQHSWSFDGEPLELLWVLDATVDRLPKMAALFDELMVAMHFSATEFPLPTDAERQEPKPSGTLFSMGSESKK
jgi:hypothetical protein